MFRILALALLALAAACSQTPVLAHEAMSGWRYPYECCSDRDCARIPASLITEGGAGYVIAIAPGDHPMWPASRSAPLLIDVSYRAARVSPDGQFHLCIDQSGRLLCFFAAVGGS